MTFKKDIEFLDELICSMKYRPTCLLISPTPSKRAAWVLPFRDSPQGRTGCFFRIPGPTRLAALPKETHPSLPPSSQEVTTQTSDAFSLSLTASMLRAFLM